MHFLRFLIIMGAELILGLSAMQAQTPSTALALHYTFENVSSSVIEDASNNNHQGQINGNAVLVNAFEGNGLQMIDKEDYIKAPENISANLTSFTFATWVKLDALKGSTRFFDWGNGADGINNFVAFIPSYGGDNRMMALRFKPSSGSTEMVFSSQRCPVGSWAHIAVTFGWDVAAGKGTATFYINGQEAGGGSAITSNPAIFLGQTSDNYFGYSRFAAETNGFNGIMDEIRLYNRLLTTSEIKEISGLNSPVADLIVKYDFSDTDANLVRDASMYQLQGTLKNDAAIQTIGTSETGIYNVLSLGSNQGYFDMGAPLGDLLVQLENYTVSAYFRIDEGYADLHQNGNFLWNFSNSANAGTDQNGYLIGSLARQSVSITPGYYTEASGNQAVGYSKTALKGNWHHMAYTQQGNTGTVYIDGVSMATSTITNTPASALVKSGLTGTPFNWIGRSCYPGDVYLRNTMVFDFRVYRRALTGEEIKTSELDVERNIARLERAVNVYEGVGKTAESQPHETSLRPQATRLMVNKTDATNDPIELPEIKDLTFSAGTMHINLMDGTVRTFTLEAVKNLLFTSGTTPLTQLPAAGSMTIFPNPATDFINIEALPANSAQIEVYSMSGHRVMTEMIHQHKQSINVSHLPTGIYILKVGGHTIKFQKR